jgi:hypothetical protein
MKTGIDALSFDIAKLHLPINLLNFAILTQKLETDWDYLNDSARPASRCSSFGPMP